MKPIVMVMIFCSCGLLGLNSRAQLPFPDPPSLPPDPPSLPPVPSPPPPVSDGGGGTSLPATPPSDGGTSLAPAPPAMDAEDEGVVRHESSVGREPGASGTMAVNRFVRNTVLRIAEPVGVAAPTPPQGVLPTSAADLFYNRWEQAGQKGFTLGLYPAVTWGDEIEKTFMLPLSISWPEDESTFYSIGLDTALKSSLSGAFRYISIGAHAFGLGFFGGGDTTYLFGGGPFVAAQSDLIDGRWLLSGGLLLELTKPENQSAEVEIIGAVNIGRQISDSFVANLFAIHYQNLDRDVLNVSYTDIGGDIRWLRGTWSIAFGAKTATGLTDAESYEFFLNSNYFF